LWWHENRSLVQNRCKLSLYDSIFPWLVWAQKSSPSALDRVGMPS
jgi:hypothetical protein